MYKNIFDNHLGTSWKNNTKIAFVLISNFITKTLLRACSNQSFELSIALNTIHKVDSRPSMLYLLSKDFFLMRFSDS